jgi:hypothetical protein
MIEAIQTMVWIAERVVSVVVETLGVPVPLTGAEA